MRAEIAVLDALAGNGERARGVLDANGSAQWSRAARAFLALAEARHAEARELFAAAAVGSRGQRVELPGWLAVFDVLLAVTSDSAGDVADVPRRIDKAKRSFSYAAGARYALMDLADFRRTGKKISARYVAHGWLDALVIALAQTWMGIEVDEAKLAAHARRARENGYAWLARELDSVSSGTLHELFGIKEGWELALESLRGAASADEAPSRRAKKDEAIWWTVNLHRASRWVDVDAAVASKAEAKGKRIAANRILDDPPIAVDEHDRRVAEALERCHDRYLLSCNVLVALVGHPRVRDAQGRHVRVEAGEPRIRVEATAKGARLRLVPSIFDGSGAAAQREDDDRIVVYTRTPVVARILSVIPREGLEIPKQGLARMSEVLGAMGASIGVDAAASLASETHDGDPRIHVQLFRVPHGMRARLRVVPGGASAPALRPGMPPAETVRHEGGALVRVMRDLAEERARLERVLDRCPTLASLPLDGDDRVAGEIETCLELLLELREAEADVVVEWLEGQPIRAPVVRGASHVEIRVKGDAKWLSVDGEVRVDEARVVEMRELLECASRARGRFVPIGDDAWLALTDDLRKKLEALGRLRGMDKDGRIPAALLAAMDDVWDGLDVSFAEDIAKRRAALEAARELDVAVPRDLGATLRDYQRDGFVFLARRTEAGIGACLADDMGLGKTVQALALLLHRRSRGPALVVAPTSVCRNWENEAARFAPSLAIRRLADGDRASVVRDANPGDVVIVSYGLLAAEQELLASRTWGTVIFDEAHALKNASTRRWSAAKAMNAEACVALTGTPVENHAGELHALVDLLVPGMLGTRAGFDRAIGSAIAEGSRDAAALLRRLVRPFILRRTKAEVLSELPPKTEVLRTVTPSAEHLAFYEALRRRAVEKMAAAKASRGGRARIELLAELTRLRRAAIDPRLVGGDDAPPGSKIEALVELVTELRAEGRRALVFSQFLEVLDLARAALEERGVTCRRLDGTMSESARADEISTFQAGAADVFLVSLKAGGVGMNLTAADFVILLDPWWNPAVEDQAAARAHRIGQAKPVTVARIVTERTIEEKVLALHAKKRQLYDDLVAGADGAGTLDVDTLAALLDDDRTSRADVVAPAAVRPNIGV
jgi:superfamily II DNA or RNA helicase